MGTASYISYHTINGRIRSGACTTTSKFECRWDALGSVVRTTQYNSPNGSSRRYAAYGTPLQKYNYYSDFRMGWVGSFGYRRTVNPHAEQYIRARHYSYTDARWITKDPLWPNEPAYNYISNPANIIDGTGALPGCVKNNYYNRSNNCWHSPCTNPVNPEGITSYIFGFIKTLFRTELPHHVSCPNKKCPPSNGKCPTLSNAQLMDRIANVMTCIGKAESNFDEHSYYVYERKHIHKRRHKPPIVTIAISRLYGLMQADEKNWAAYHGSKPICSYPNQVAVSIRWVSKLCAVGRANPCGSIQSFWDSINCIYGTVQGQTGDFKTCLDGLRAYYGDNTYTPECLAQISCDCFHYEDI